MLTMQVFQNHDGQNHYGEEAVLIERKQVRRDT